MSKYLQFGDMSSKFFQKVKKQLRTSPRFGGCWNSTNYELLSFVKNQRDLEVVYQTAFALRAPAAMVHENVVAAASVAKILAAHTWQSQNERQR